MFKLKGVCLLLGLLILISCSRKAEYQLSKQPDAYAPFEGDIIENFEKDGYAIALIPVGINGSISYQCELRIYDITFAQNAKKQMEKYFGSAHYALDGKYQDNIFQYVWNNIKLLENENLYHVWVDGTETQTEYFTSFLVLDAKHKNCLCKTHVDYDLTLKTLLDRHKKMFDTN